jgi:LPXTG-motif cell wall-anchored protein
MVKLECVSLIYVLYGISSEIVSFRYNYPDPRKDSSMNSTFRKFGATLSVAAIAGLGLALPASAATVGEWGVWQADEGGDFLTFSNTNMSDATFSVEGEDEWYLYSPDGEDEGFSADTPVGAVIGANDTSTDNLFLKVTTIDDNDADAVVTVTFDEAVPAGNLVLAVSDVDSDHAVVEMEDANGNDLTGLEIVGTATDTGFNFEDLSSTDRPTLEVSLGGSAVTIGDAPDNTDGSTGWVRPSEAVKAITITINTEDGNYSSQRIWIGQLGDELLAKTGAADSMYLVAFAGAAILATAGIARRRTN